MKLYVPYSRTADFPKDERLTFYQACGDTPEVNGGRYREVVAPRLLSKEEMVAVLEKYRHRFQVTMNSCFPVVTNIVRYVLDAVQANNANVCIARIEIAREIRDLYPDLKMQASCIMGFYSSLQEIVDSGLFTAACGTQKYNYEVQAMIDFVPEKLRGFVYYIINSHCRWGQNCQAHYEDISRKYIDGEYGSAPFCSNSVFKETDLGTLWKRLKASGFVAAKLQGRNHAAYFLRESIERILEEEGGSHEHGADSSSYC